MSGNSNGYLPLPNYLTVKNSPIHGLGLFAVKNLPAGKELGITHVEDRKQGRFPNDSIRTPLGGFVNHSNRPNCVFYEIGDTWRLKTLKPVKEGAELTAKYDGWYDDTAKATFK